MPIAPILPNPTTLRELESTNLESALNGDKYDSECVFRSRFELIPQEIRESGFIRKGYGEEYLIIKDVIVKPNPPINIRKKNLPNIIFYKCIIETDITFQNCKCNYSFLLLNSKCNKINIEVESEWGDISVSDNSSCYELNIHNSKTANIKMAKNSIISQILAKNNSQCGDISIQNSTCKNILVTENSQSGYIEISNNSQSENIWVSKNSQSRSIRIDNNSQSGYIEISDNSQSRNIWVRKNSQSGDIWIENKSQSGDIWIRDRSQSGYISIFDNSQSGDIRIENKSQSGNIGIRNSSTGALGLEDCYLSLTLFNAQITIAHFKNCHFHAFKFQAKGECYFNGCFINYLDLENSSIQKDSVISIVDTQIYFAQFQESIILGQVVLRGVRALEKPFDWSPPLMQYLMDNTPRAEATELESNIYQEKVAALTSQKESYEEKLEDFDEEYVQKPTFMLVNSTMGKTEITGSDLTGFNFVYKGTKMVDMFISGTKLPEEIEIYEVNARSLIEYEQKVSYYSQLRKIMDNTGNIVEAGKYHSLALENQSELLALEYQNLEKKWYEKLFSKTAFDIINFWLNQVSNIHGESWGRALGFTFCVGVLFYIFYNLSLFGLNPCCWTWNGVGIFWRDFITFLNPTHFMNFRVETTRLTLATQFFDFLGRIFIGYGIYQLIVAFRRHGKK